MKVSIAKGDLLLKSSASSSVANGTNQCQMTESCPQLWSKKGGHGNLPANTCNEGVC
jgi:hypothetical protein